MENIGKLVDTTLEQVVLGCILIDGDLIYSTSLKPDDFYRSTHQEIFKTMLELKEEGSKVDPVVLYDRLQKKNSDITLSYLLTLTNNVPTTLNFSNYEKEVKEKAYKRKIYFKLLKLKDKIENNFEFNEIIDDINHLIDEKDFEVDLETFKKQFSKIFDKILYNNKVEYIPLGIKKIDNDIGGFQRGTLNIVACRPSIGKTSLALQIALNMLKQNKNVLFFSLEMSIESLIRRMLSMITKIPLSEINNSELSTEQINELVKGFDFLYNKNFDIIDRSMLSIEDVERITNVYYNNKKVDVLIIDYLSLMQMPDNEKKVDAIGEISRRLKLLAKKLNIIVLLLVQLNRNTEERTEKRPILADLRDSGNLEQDADMVFLIWRKPLENGLPSDVGEIILAKHRDGKTNFYPIVFDNKTLEFKDVN